jgi:hypothetical protein
MTFHLGGFEQRVSLVIGGLVYTALGCSSSSSSPDAGKPAATDSVTVSANPNSVLSELVSFTVTGGASQARILSSGPAEQLATPPLSLDEGGKGQIAVLGLAAGTPYKHVVEKTSQGTTNLVPGPDAVTTAALPPELSTLSFGFASAQAEPEVGYFLVSGAGPDTFAVDGSGVIRWYRAFGAGTAEAKMQVDGSFTTYVGGSTGSELTEGEYVRYTPDGAQTATYTATSPDPTEAGSPTVFTDPHELLITKAADGTDRLHLLGYVSRPASASDSTPYSWHELLRQRSDGTVEFRWKTWSYFSIADQMEMDRPGDLDHANAIAIDPADGNYIVSFRSLDALVKIDYQTGAVVWQLGGKQNQFTFVGDPLMGFQGQHSVRVLANGDLLLYDNGLHHSPPESRAVEYRIDPAAKTATFVWQFRHTPAIQTQFVGSVERLESGNTLVAFGWVGLVDEVDPSGTIVWEAQLQNGGATQRAYRVRRLPNLYTFAEP